MSHWLAGGPIYSERAIPAAMLVPTRTHHARILLCGSLLLSTVTCSRCLHQQVLVQTEFPPTKNNYGLHQLGELSTTVLAYKILAYDKIFVSCKETEQKQIQIRYLTSIG